MRDWSVPTLADTIAARPQLSERGDPTLRAADEEVLWRYMPWWKFETTIHYEARAAANGVFAALERSPSISTFEFQTRSL